jgi:hypothetical protein
VRSTPSSVAAPAVGLATAELDGERLLWRDGHLRCLDPVASVIWPHLDGQATLEEIASAAAAAFGEPLEPVAQDLVRLFDALWSDGYISLDGAAKPEAELHATGERPIVRFGNEPPPGRRSDLDEVPWVFESPRYRALQHDFSVRTTDPWVAAYVERRLAVLQAPGEAERAYSVVATGDHGGARYETYLDGEGLLSTASLDLVVRHLLWHINQAVLRGDIDHLLVHASAAVTDDGSAIVLPGNMNAGKSTTVAALVRRGFAYLTDEMAAIDPASGRIDPYPRPVNLGRGSWTLLPELQPADWSPEQPCPPDVWHVDPRAMGRLGEPCAVGYIVAPRYEEGAVPTLVPISPAEGAELLYHHAFNAKALGRQGFSAVVAAAASTSCARLVSGDLEGSVALIRRFVQKG